MPPGGRPPHLAKNPSVSRFRPIRSRPTADKCKPLYLDGAGVSAPTSWIRAHASAGEWLVEKHGTKTRRSWRKLHIGLDADTGQIVAAALTAKEVDDGSEVGPLLDQVPGPVASFTGDGACDQDGVSTAVAQRRPDAAVIVPPRSTAVPSETVETEPTQRDRICKASPSTDGQPGRKSPDTRSGPESRRPSAGSSR